jgi:hypothetical protein
MGGQSDQSGQGPAGSEELNMREMEELGYGLE